MLMTWMCPHCRQNLVPGDVGLACENRHSFDVAREGYVNLLTSGQKAGLKGDTPEMLAARRRFLGSGWYGPMRRRLIELVGELPHAVVADAGCGEGYYIGGICAEVPEAQCFGTDIAKKGVALGAREYSGVNFAVADTNMLLPLADGSADVLLDVFAPRNAAEFERVLRPDGRLIVVIPTERHLAELREIQPLLAIQPDKRQVVETGLQAGFVLESVEVLTLPLALTGVAVMDLIGMTPNAWFLDDEQRQTLENAGAVAATAEFEILVFKKA